MLSKGHAYETAGIDQGYRALFIWLVDIDKLLCFASHQLLNASHFSIACSHIQTLLQDFLLLGGGQSVIGGNGVFVLSGAPTLPMVSLSSHHLHQTRITVLYSRKGFFVIVGRSIQMKVES